MQVGIDSFAAAFDENSRAVNPSERLRQLVQQIEHADEVGLDAFGVGEHHRREFLDSALAVILGAAAARTQRIRLTSAVTVLSAEDPVRAFQNFATLDLLSRGRAEMIVGRGSSIEAFPLFGFRLEDYDSLFAEKLDLLLTICEHEHVHWSGKHRAALTGQGVYPRPVQNPLPIWLGVGGTPQSFVRAGQLGLPLMVAVAIRKAVGSRESTRMMRSISLTTPHDDSMGWTRSSLSGPRQRSTNSSSSCTRITDPLHPRSQASRRRIIRPGERSSPTPEAISRRATEGEVLARSLDIRLSGLPVRAGRPPRGGARITKWITRTVSRRHGPAKLTPRSHQARTLDSFPICQRSQQTKRSCTPLAEPAGSATVAMRMTARRLWERKRPAGHSSANSSRMTSRQIALLSSHTSTRHGSGMRDRRN